MTRRVGFGEEPSGGGGVPWGALLVAILVIAVAISVFDPGLAERAGRWAFGSDGDGGALFPIAAALAALFAAQWLLRRVLRGFFRAERRPGERESGEDTSAESASGESAPPARPRGAAGRISRAITAKAGAEQSTRSSSDTPGSTPMAGSKAGGCFAIAFLMFWLCGWTVGIIFAVSSFLDGFSSGAGGPHWFLLIWIAFALVGWVVAAGILLGLFRDVFARR